MSDGINVCLHCFNGGCIGEKNHSKIHSIQRNHPLVVNVRRTRKVIERDEPPAKMSKLAIAAETEADRYNTYTKVLCLDCDQVFERADVPESVNKVVEGVMAATAHSRQEEIKAWEQELTTCEHILMLNQGSPRKIEAKSLANCSMCDLNENLWLCLECGNLGCGRAQFGGVGGNGHALEHYNQSHHKVAVKLGSITPEGTADVYCYMCDDEKVDEQLGTHLANWGIILAERQKTEKSLTEMQIEQNLKWDFSMVSPDGKQLIPRFGPGLTGLKNLGNSCYMASILQCLFDLSPFHKRYFLADLPLDVLDPANDLETQLQKIAKGLISGQYSVPDPNGANDAEGITYQRGIAPSMLKALVGRGHHEFSTMRQQDALEFMQHLFKLVTRSPHPASCPDPTQAFRFVVEERLQCLGCHKVRYTSTEHENIMINIPIEEVLTGEGESFVYKPVTMKECFDAYTREEKVDLTCSGCNSKEGYTKRPLFKTFPEVLVVAANKMIARNWVPVKVDVPVIVGDEVFNLDDYISPGKQESEEALPEEPSPNKPSFTPNAAGLEQMEAMGMPKNRCIRALYATGNDPNAAMEWLFEHMDDPDIDDPLDLGGGGGSGTTALDSEKLEMLGAMGIATGKAKKALRATDGDVERAVDWVFSHPEVGDEDDDAAAAAALQEQAEAGSSDLPARFSLKSIVCHKGASIHTG